MSSITHPRPGPSTGKMPRSALVDVGIAAGHQNVGIDPRLASRAIPSQTGMWVAVSAITMSFAALTSALVVREGSAGDWQHFVLPRVLYLNTLILVASSFTLELSRKRMAVVTLGPDERRKEVDPRIRANAVYWIHVTLVLGLIFLMGQVLAWKSLAAQGLFLATSPSSSFFYVFTGLHGLHLLGGVVGLIYVSGRVSRGIQFAQATALEPAAVYWHFMGILWVYLLLILSIRI